MGNTPSTLQLGEASNRATQIKPYNRKWRENCIMPKVIKFKCKHPDCDAEVGAPDQECSTRECKERRVNEVIIALDTDGAVK